MKKTIEITKKLKRKNHEVITETDSNSSENSGESYSQAGWQPDVHSAKIINGAVYRLDGDGPNRAIKVTNIGQGLNAITYTREGLA